MKKFRIVSDGTPTKTKVFDDTGRDVTAAMQVTGVEWKIDATHQAEIIIHAVGMEIEAVGELVVRDPEPVVEP